MCTTQQQSTECGGLHMRHDLAYLPGIEMHIDKIVATGNMHLRLLRARHHQQQALGVDMPLYKREFMVCASIRKVVNDKRGIRSVSSGARYHTSHVAAGYPSARIQYMRAKHHEARHMQIYASSTSYIT
jgi:hypothetical protein